MNRRTRSLTPEYFAGLYAEDLDPWRFASSDYERAKYEATLASLPRPRYAAALEIGCSIGVLTHALAERCDDLIAVDVVPSVLEEARRRCHDRPNVRFAQCAVPEQWPDGRFELILVSEVAYFLDRPDLLRLVERVMASLAENGEVILVHWLGATDYPLSGDEAAEGFIEAFLAGAAGGRVREQRRTADYRLDLLQAGSEP